MYSYNNFWEVKTLTKHKNYNFQQTLTEALNF